MPKTGEETDKESYRSLNPKTGEMTAENCTRKLLL